MKTYKIKLVDLVTGETEEVEEFKTIEHSYLKQRLLELQKGYCEDEKPTIKIRFRKLKNGKTAKFFMAFSNTDFSYSALVDIIH